VRHQFSDELPDDAPVLILLPGLTGGSQVSQWSYLSELVVPHRWGTRLGVWSRPPAQSAPSARKEPGVDVAFPRLRCTSRLQK
jgi:hypothetical protein